MQKNVFFLKKIQIFDSFFLIIRKNLRLGEKTMKKKKKKTRS